ncbi:MAG: hypothetical protein C5B55_12310 [Blastocatellia bacterium]|nr:MAG: hypothetical protein C5B55_12310 [Blastocatellia bacterium]
MPTPYSLNERRAAPRRTATCVAEVVANLSILDTETESTSQPLVFCGQTIDLSACGIGLVIPSLHVDDRFCETDNRLRLSVHLPNGPVTVEVNAVRCSPLNQNDRGQGYFLGTRILNVLQHEPEFEEYLRSLEDQEKQVK